MLLQSSCGQYFKSLSFCLFLSCATAPWITMANAQSNSPVVAAQVFKIPMHFMNNAGQTDPRVDFISRGPGYTLFLTPTQAVFSLFSTKDTNEPQKRRSSRHPRSRIVEQTDLQMNLLGANPHAVPEAGDPLPGTVNFLIGNNPEH